MKKSYFILVAAIASSIAFGKDSPFELNLMAAEIAGVNVEPIWLDIGNKCGVDPRKQDQSWFNAFSSVINKPHFTSAVKAHTEGNRAAYQRSINALSCPAV